MLKCISRRQASAFDEDLSDSEAESCRYSDEVSTDIETELYSRLHYTEQVERMPSDAEEKAEDPTPSVNFSATAEASKSAKRTQKHKKLPTAPPKNEVKRSPRKPVKTSTPANRTTKMMSGTRLSSSSECSLTVIDSTSGTSDDDSYIEVIDADSSNDVTFLTNVNSKSSVSSNSDDFPVNRSLSNQSGKQCKGMAKLRLQANTPSWSTTTVSRKSSKMSGQADHDAWQVSKEDSISKSFHNAFQQRYFGKFSVKCKSCGETGHKMKNCPAPRLLKCYLCGGGHRAARCMKKVCGRCFASGHDKRRCWFNCNALYCQLCKVEGHEAQRCPDNWRRYCFTTTSQGIVKPTAGRSSQGCKYCYNCGFKGHFGHQCDQPRMCWKSAPSSPYVKSFKDSWKSKLNKAAPAMFGKGGNARKITEGARGFCNSFGRSNGYRKSMGEPSTSTDNVGRRRRKKWKQMQTHGMPEENSFRRTPKHLYEVDSERKELPKKKRKKKKSKYAKKEQLNL